MARQKPVSSMKHLVVLLQRIVTKSREVCKERIPCHLHGAIHQCYVELYIKYLLRAINSFTRATHHLFLHFLRHCRRLTIAHANECAACISISMQNCLLKSKPPTGIYDVISFTANST